MIPVFVDTSAFVALVAASDPDHAAASRAFDRLRSRKAPLLTTSYVLAETYALLARRFGPEAVRAFREQMAPLLLVEWIDAHRHETGLDGLLAEPGRQHSLVDATSFAVARAAHVEEVFAFDRRFEEKGFRLLR